MDATIELRRGKIVHRPFVKPTSKGVPLSESSVHKRSTHVSWMKGEIQRLSRLSTNHDDFVFAKGQFLDRLKLHFVSQSAFARLTNYDPYLGNLLRSSRESPSSTKKHWTLVLPFVQSLYDSRIKQNLEFYFCNSEHVQSIWQGFHKHYRIAWSNAGPKLSDMTKKCVLRVAVAGGDGSHHSSSCAQPHK